MKTAFDRVTGSREGLEVWSKMSRGFLDQRLKQKRKNLTSLDKLLVKGIRIRPQKENAVGETDGREREEEK